LSLPEISCGDQPLLISPKTWPRKADPSRSFTSLRRRRACAAVPAETASYARASLLLRRTSRETEETERPNASAIHWQLHSTFKWLWVALNEIALAGAQMMIMLINKTPAISMGVVSSDGNRLTP
jgi:hypothetical protein